MQPVALDRHLHGTLTVDVCAGCHALWFDVTESLQLSPAGTLQLFRTISDAGPVHGDRTGSPLPCPRCDTPLTHTQDLQHTTRFAYYRCRHGHGRYTPYVQFLREKNFIRQVSPADLERLKKLVRIVRCSSCGAPIDLERQTACGYCRAPIAILDQEAVARTLRELDHAAARPARDSKPRDSSAR